MPDVAEMILADLKAKYDDRFSSRKMARLYDDDEFGHIFAVLQGELNQHFEDINGRAERAHHYWADNGREMLDLISELKKDLHKLQRAGVEVAPDKRYEEAIARCKPWLSRSGGSTVPDDFEQIEVIEYEPVFRILTASVGLKKQQTPITLKMIGEGSYAHVYSYVDPDYDIRFAIKRAKRGIAERDLVRFKQEVYHADAALVKLSDFGLVKDADSTFTRTQTEMRGTIRDPLLDNFRDYVVLNEIYSIGFVLSYIFTGRESLKSDGDEVSRIVQKCTIHDTAARYQALPELIIDVERLESMPTDTSA